VFYLSAFLSRVPVLISARHLLCGLSHAIRLTSSSCSVVCCLLCFLCLGSLSLRWSRCFLSRDRFLFASSLLLSALLSPSSRSMFAGYVFRPGCLVVHLSACLLAAPLSFFCLSSSLLSSLGFSRSYHSSCSCALLSWSVFSLLRLVFRSAVV